MTIGTHDLGWLMERPIAHRGLHDMNRECWENTLSAFERACRKGYAIECDVTISADGVPVVIHDTNLVRLTGQYGWVYRHSARTLRTMRIGRTKEQVPLLQDMLDLVDGRVPLVIELKGARRFDGPLVEAVANALAGYGGKAAIMSFDHHLVRRFPADADGIPVGLTAEGLSDKEIEGHFAMLAHGLSFVSYNVHQLENRFVDFARDRLSMPVISWTIRDAQTAERARRLGTQITFEGFDPA
jgi:glycerophosphoryl diester phosphodiesterase